MTSKTTVFALPSGPVLYSGAAGKLWTDGADLYGLTARGVRVQGVMPGGPANQPTPAEMEAVTSAAKNAYGKQGPWLAALAALLVFLALSALGAPTWVKVLVGLAGVVGLLTWPLRRQYQAFSGLFERREELTLLLSDTPTTAVSRVVEVGPDLPAQTLGPSDQPVAVVVRGLTAAERVKLAGAITRHTALGQLRAGRGGK